MSVITHPYPTRFAIRENTGILAATLSSEMWDMIVSLVPREGWGTLRAVCKRLHAVVQRRLPGGKVPPTPLSYAALSSTLYEWVYLSPIPVTSLPRHLCANFARYGLYDEMVDTHERLRYPLNKADIEAASGGHLRCLQYATINHPPIMTGDRWIPEMVVEAAAQAGSLECMLYAMKYYGLQGYLDGMMAAARGGNPACMQAMHDPRLINAYSTTMYYEVNLFPREITLTHSPVMMAAADHGNASCLVAGHALGMPLAYGLISIATRRGWADCLRVLAGLGCSYSHWVANVAASHGHLECLKVISTWPDAVINDDTLRAAVRHPDCMLFLCEYGLLPDTSVMMAAAERGSLAGMRFLHERQCPWAESTVDAAVEADSEECVRYALEHGCPVTTTAVEYAVGDCNEPMLELLLELKCPVDKRHTDMAAGLGFPSCLELLHKHGAPCDEVTYRQAIRHGKMDCLVYLHKAGVRYKKHLLPRLDCTQTYLSEQHLDVQLYVEDKM